MTLVYVPRALQGACGPKSGLVSPCLKALSSILRSSAAFGELNVSSTAIGDSGLSNIGRRWPTGNFSGCRRLSARNRLCCCMPMTRADSIQSKSQAKLRFTRFAHSGLVGQRPQFVFNEIQLNYSFDSKPQGAADNAKFPHAQPQRVSR